jgi:hypothetical protein
MNSCIFNKTKGGQGYAFVEEDFCFYF